jgi:hypothetical protein
VNVKKLVKVILVLPVLLALAISLGSCVDFNTGGGGGSGKSTVNGNVADVIDGSDVSGIKVTAIRNGKKADSDTTDSQGNFKLRVKKGDITLQFETSTFNVSREITVTKKSTVILVVVLDPDQGLVTIDNWQVLQDPIRCNNSDEFIFEEEEVSEFIINKGNCIRAKGDCPVSILVQNISLTDCKEGIRAEGDATVEFEALEDINLISTKDGISSKKNAFVSLSAGNDIFITSTEENGIKAEDSSTVVIQPTNQCTIQGAKKSIQEDDTATVDPDDCTF